MINELGITIRKNSKEIKNLLKNLDDKKIIKIDCNWHEINITKDEFLNFFNENYAFMGIEKYKDQRYSFHNSIEYYNVKAI